MSIQPLPGDVVAKIKSSIIITSLNAVVSGLLQNSFDARASRINVSVDFSRGNCSVEDDGLGILPSSFRENGGLGQLHYTSRYPPRADCHGRHGGFLASLGTLSLLTIASHHHEYRSHNCLTIHNSKVIARNVPALPEQRVLTFPYGTRVTVRDLFGSMPVRVKQRAMEMERLGSAKSFDQLIFTTVGLLLAWPAGIVVSLQDVTSSRSVVLHTSTLAKSHSQMARELSARTCSLLGQASLLEQQDPKTWVSIGASVTGVSVSGCVCLVPVATKGVQFMALGVQPLLNENQSNVLYEEVNKVFANSRFGEIEEIELDEDGAPRKTEGFTLKELKPKRGLDRWPVFFIQITLEDQMESLNTDGLIDDSNRNLTMITDLLQVMVYEFLKKHHFHPRAVNAFDRLKQPKTARSHGKTPPVSISSKHTQKSGSRSSTRLASSKSRSSSRSLPGGISRSSSASPFTSWTQTKPASVNSAASKSIDLTPSTNPKRSRTESSRDDLPLRSSQTYEPLFNKAGQLLRKPFDDAEEKQTNPGPQKSTEPIVWIDPATKLRALIDPSSGFEIKSKKTSTRDSSHNTIADSSSTSLLELFRHQKIPARKEATAFEPVEPPIPRVPELPDAFNQGHGACNHKSGDLGNIQLDLPTGAGASMTTYGRISKDALRDAEILGQVDKKFILAKLSTAESSSDRSLLVFIDQHAADERCRVESLMRDYFWSVHDGRIAAQTQVVGKPLRFELSQQEGKLMARYQSHFEHWGVRYEVFLREDGERSHKGTVSRTATVEVQALPPSIIERCRLEPRLLVDLVRKEVWKLHDNPRLAASGEARSEQYVEGDVGWVARFHQCPEGILEMINSRACRSAIMFNDVLDKDQCVDLVQRLARCAFPFQCAHGRPSMVPIVDLGGAAVGESSLGGLFGKNHQGKQKGGLLKGLKKWADEKKSGGSTT
ncbi:hypothetical protein V8F20_002752 [Naviculisporaceae sp. PSN 640]